MARESQPSRVIFFIAQVPVLEALLLRELKTRFGQFRFGYLWALAEPLAHVVILSVIFGMRSPTTAQGVEFPIFLATGIIPFLLFSNMVNRSMTAITANQALFNYRQVKPLDTLVTRFILEVVIYAAVFVTFMTGAGWLGFDVSVQDPLTVLLVFLALGLFGLGLGALACVGATLAPDVAQVVPIILRPLYFISGIFFSVEVIPAEYRPWLLWNPILHAMELIRGSWFHAIDNHYGDPVYLAWWVVASLALGLLTFHVNRTRMVAS